MALRKWKSTTIAANELGCTAKFLRENRLKLFKAGRHYRLVNPNAYRPTYRWHVERCEKVLNQATHQADKEQAGQVAAAKGRGTQLPFIDGVAPYEIE